MNKYSFNSIEELKQNKIFENFFKLCEIPRKTFDEKAVSDYIYKWAKENNFYVEQDEKNNLFIKKKASSGYEDKKPIILQAHLDMVCEKRENAEHNFSKDSIKCILEGDILSTGNRTTLGADDGIGVAIAMAILCEKDLKHPEINVIFTTAEEEDMSGALAVAKKWFNTNRIINIDNNVDNILIVGSCGGKGVELKIRADFINFEDRIHSYKLKISNLTGGHSGEDINKGYANSNILAGSILNSISKENKIYINDIKGGNFRLAIPIETTVYFSSDRDILNQVEEFIENFKREILEKYKLAEKNLKIEFEEIESKQKCLTVEVTDKLIKLLVLSPNGINDMMHDINVVESSCNLGEVYIEDDYIYFITEIRAAYEYSREFIYNKIVALASIFDAEVRDFAIYPSWSYNTNSSLQKKAEEVYLKMFNEKMNVIVLHAGLECACFEDKVEGMEAISIGPNTWSLHSPEERLSVASTIKIYKYLYDLIENL